MDAQPQTLEAAWASERRKYLVIIARQMLSLGWTEAHYGRMEMDMASAVVITEDAKGNVTVRSES